MLKALKAPFRRLRVRRVVPAWPAMKACDRRDLILDALQQCCRCCVWYSSRAAACCALPHLEDLMLRCTAAGLLLL